MKDKTERRLKKAKVTLMRNKLFALYSGILMLGKTEIRDDMPTACTNGRDEIYGRAFLEKCSDKEIAWTVLHENGHKMYRHLTIWRRLFDEHPQLANVACDHYINLELYRLDPNEEFISHPRLPNGERFGCFDTQFEGMNSKQIFDKIKEECKKNGTLGEKGEGGGEGDSQGGGFDIHDWENAKGMSQKEKEELEREIDRAIRQGALQHQKLNGVGAGGLDRELGDLLAPQIDWREALREFVTSICSGRDASSWRRVNRRFIANDIYLPTLISEKIGRVVIGVDASGSTWCGNVLDRFLSEVKAIGETVKPEKVDIIYWDYVVQSHEIYEQNEVDTIIANTKIKGGGGTKPDCVEELLKKENIKPECIIMLTDGYVPDWGHDWPAPILWVIAGNDSATADTGKTVHIKDD